MLMDPVWKPSEVGTVFATRELSLRAAQAEDSVVVEFGVPVRAPQPDEYDPWWCPVRISGWGTPRLQFVAGEDSLQAVMLALQFAKARLASLATEVGGEVFWIEPGTDAIWAEGLRGLL